jgi:hypothetical protein
MSSTLTINLQNLNRLITRSNAYNTILKTIVLKWHCDPIQQLCQDLILELPIIF